MAQASPCAAGRGQGEALNIDRRDFHGELYAALREFPLRPLVEGADDWAVAPVPEQSADPPRPAELRQPADAGASVTMRLLRLADDVLCGTRYCLAAKPACAALSCDELPDYEQRLCHELYASQPLFRRPSKQLI